MPRCRSSISLRLYAVCVALLILTLPSLWAQATQGSINIAVTDPANATIPNAKLELRSITTNDLRTATTQENGTYRFVGLNNGNYELTITKEGFAKSVISPVVVETARVTDVIVQLKIGTTTAAVEVVSSAQPVLEVSSNMIGTTMDLRQIESLPLGGRDLTQLSRLAPGYTGNGAQGSWNGAPSVAQGNNIDGVIASPSRMKFTGNAQPSIAPRLENIEEMTVQTDQLDMDQGFGQATMQINFITKAGTNAYHGLLYEDFRNSALNANTWSNNQRGTPKPPLILNDFGGSVGGPILKNKLFFFGSFGMSKQPGSIVATNMVLTQAAQSGIFTYSGTDNGSHTVNVLNIAKSFGGLPSTINSTIASELAAIGKSVQYGAISPSPDPNINWLNWLLPSPVTNYFPAGRIDYNASENLRFRASFNQQRRIQPTSGAPLFPGPDFANQGAGFKSNGAAATMGIDWTATPTVVNQFKAGFLYIATWNPWNQGAPIWNTSVGQVSWNFLNVDWPYGGYMSGQLYDPFLPISNYYPVITLSDSVSWQRGKHQMKFGFSGYQEHDKYWNAPAGITNYNLGLANGDPALAAFTNSGTSPTVPKATSSELAQAQQLYAVLIGRIQSATGQFGYDPKKKAYNQTPGSTYNLNEMLRSWGLFAQDSWRVTPSLTINLGLRWDFTGDNYDLSGAYHNALPKDIYGPSGIGNLFQPGKLGGEMNPTIVARPHAYNGWKVSPQPMVGVAWKPDFKSGFLGKLMGDRTVVRGGFSLRRFTEPQQYFWNQATDYGALYFQQYYLNPNTSGQAGTFAPGSLSLGDKLPTFGYSPHATYEVTAPLSEYTFMPLNYLGNIVNGMNPNISQPYTQAWNIGVQRELGQSRVLEIRYNGSRSRDLWLSRNINEVNIFENGFLTQFKAAQQNLKINQQHGINSFANNGYSGQTATPIFNAAFAGEAPGGSGVPLEDYGNTQFLNYLNTGQAGAFANVLSGIGGPVPYFCNLVGSSFAPCATNGGYTGAGAGYPINVFQANPFSAGMPIQYMDSVGYSNYHALQIDLRQRQWHGIQFDANYTWSHTLGVSSPNEWEAASSQYTVRDLRLSYGPTLFDTRHVVHVASTVDLPFGKGRRWANQGGIVNHLVGGWNVGTILTVQSGKPAPILGGYNTFNDYGDGGVVFNGITGKDLQDSVGVTYAPRRTFVYLVDPNKYITNRSQYMTPNTTPGTVGQVFYLYGPRQTTADASLTKTVHITERVRFFVQAEFLNVFNHPTFGWRGNLSSQNNIQSSSFGTGVLNTGSAGGGNRQIELRANIAF